MFDPSPDSRKIALTCRFIQHDQWLTTHIESSWTIRQLKIWLIHRLFAIPVPHHVFAPPSSSGKAPDRPPSPITFAPDPRTRPASPIIFAPPQKSGFYGSATGRGWLSDTDEELFSGDEGGLSSSATLAKKRSRMMTINVGPGGSHSDSDDSSRIHPTQYPRSPTSSSTPASPPSSASNANPDIDKFPGAINPSHWTLIRYSTGQLLPDEDFISWNDIHEFELVELHGPTLPSTHMLYEYQVCHLWNPERQHQERERLKGKLKKRFESEIANFNKHPPSRDKNRERDKSDASRAAYHTQVLKALSLDSNSGSSLGVIEYYGQRLAKAKVVPSLTRIPRSIDVYVQPYWEGWVRTLRIVYRGNPHEVAFLAAMGGATGPSGASAAVAGAAGGSNTGGGQGAQDSYRFGTGPMPNGFSSGPQFGYFDPKEKSLYHNSASGGGSGRGSSSGDFKVVRVEWRERWVTIRNGYLIVLREPNNEEATHVLPLKNIISLMDTRHLVRYLPYCGFNPPLDHPSVNQDILIPAMSLPISRPPRPSHGYFDESSSDESNYNRHHRKGVHSSSAHHSQGHHSSGSWPGGGVGGALVGGGVGGSERGGREYNFDFRDAGYLRQHMKARELTPLVGSRFDPTYLPVTNEEQKASGLRVVCLQFRKPTPSTTSTTSRSVGEGGTAGADEFLSSSRRKSKLERAEEREKIRERERAKDNEVDPATLALEDMKERAGEWGGLRSNNPLWKCPSRLRREPIYIYRFKTRMRMRYSRNASITTTTTTSASTATQGRGRGGETKSRESSGGKVVNQDILSVGGSHHRRHHRQQQQHHRRQQPYRKERVYHEREKDRKYHDLEGMLAAQFLGGVPTPAEEKERKAEKARRKKEKEEEKERLKLEKEARGAGSGGKEKDWKLGSLNVDFWNWGKKKKKAKQEKEMKLRLEEHERKVEEHFAAASASAYRVPQGAGESSTTLMTGSTIPSTTVIGSAIGARSAGVSSDEDAHWDRTRSETSNVETTEDDDEDDEDASEDEEEEKEAKDEDEEEDDGVPEPYPDSVPPARSVVRDDDDEEEEEEEDEIEYANQPGADPTDPSSSSVSVPEASTPGASHESLLTPGTGNVPSVVVQVEVDKRVETETETEDANRRRSKTITGSRKGKEPERSSSSYTITTTAGQQKQEQHIAFERPSPGRRLVGQLHTSDDERNDIGDTQQDDDDDESDLSSPIFAPPPSMRRAPTTSSRYNNNARSISSHRSSTSFDGSLRGSTTGDADSDGDLAFGDELLDFKRSGYRYGLYSNRREGGRKGFRREMEEKKEREAKIREQRKLEEKEVMLEKERMERDRERRERKKKEEEGEWVCLDLGNDFAFTSFLRIVHQHCPHPMKSTFLERMWGGPLNDHPPPPSQSSAKKPPTTLQSIIESSDTLAPRARRETTPTRDPAKSPPMPPSTPSVTSPSSGFGPSYSDDSETEYVAPLPGYGDPRFQYPSRTSGTLPYPEWRLNVLRKAQRAGTGDVGRAMEMLYWGREDPVIAGASGVAHGFERLAMRQGKRGGIPGFSSYGGGGGGGGKGSGTEDNVSSLGTIGPMTVGSGGTIGPMTVGSGSSGTVNTLSPAQQRRMSASGRSIQSATSPKQAVVEVPPEGGDSGNESSNEDSEDGVSTTSSVGAREQRKRKKSRKRVSMGKKLVDWSDDEEDNTSELEWAGWQMDLQRQAKRQYAIRARRDVESAWESDEGLAELGLPVNPTDDMKKYVKHRYQLEPEAVITLGERPEVPDAQTTLVSASTQISSTSTSLTTSSPLARITTSDTLSSQQHRRTPSQNSHTLHHSASLHTGLKKEASPLRRPSMPILNVNVHHENRVDRGKAKARSFREITSLGSSNDEAKSPTMPNTIHGLFTSIGGGSGSGSKDREGMTSGGSGGGASGSAAQVGSTSGSAGRSGNILGRGKLKRKEGSEHERERGKGNEGGQQRPQLRVATSPSVGSPSSAAAVESMKSPTFGAHRRLTRMRSDASILSNTEASAPSHTKKKGVMGKLRNLADSSIGFVEGN